LKVAKKKVVKPIASLRFDFAEALENLCGQSMMMLQAVSSLLQHGNLKPSVRKLLQERHDALRDALIGEE
jgi:hypothetical protein